MGYKIISEECILERTPRMLAEMFCNMNDEEQAQFFIECVEIAKTWQWPDSGTLQWWLISKHLKGCSCSNEETRQMIKELGSEF